MTIGTLIQQKLYEQIKYTIRRHPITFAPYICLFIILLAMPIGVYWLLINSSLISLLNNPVSYVIVVLAASVYYLAVIMFFYTYFVTFHLDMWIVTNDRILDMEQKSLFARTIAEVDLYQIQDTSSEVKGFFPSLFNYGNITLQTAGHITHFVFRNVHNPHQLRQTIMDLAAEDKKYHEK